jgi:hypothetical protein
MSTVADSAAAPRVRKVFRHWDAKRVVLSALQYAMIFAAWYLPGLDLQSAFRSLASYFSSPFQFYLVFTIVLFEVTWAFGFILLGIVYHFDRWFESYKCASSEWPWWRDEETSKSYTALVKKSVDEYVGNQIANIVSLGFIFYFSDYDTDVRFSLLF